MPEGSCVKARPRCAHQQDGHRGLAASEGVQGVLRRRTRVLADAATGVGWRAAWWQRAPTPLAGRCAPL